MDSRRRSLAGRPWLILFAGGLALVVLSFRPLVEGDGIGYFSYLHAILVGHSLDLRDEYGAAIAAHAPLFAPLFRRQAAGGLPADYFPVGPALLALPFYLVALATHPDGSPVFGPPFTTAFALASLAWGLLAAVFAWALAGATGVATRAWTRALAVAVAVVASPFLYYLADEPGYSHTFSAAAAGAFLLAWWTTREGRSRRAWLLLGVLAGLMAAIRFEDGLLAPILLLDLPRARWRALLALPGVLLGFLPQLLVDLVLFGSPAPARPPGQALTPWPGHYLDVLVSSHHGLFTWTPAALLALVGVFLLRPPALRAACLYAWVAITAINGAVPDWTSSASPGARRFLVLLPVFALGLTALFERVPRVLAVAAGALLGAWNLVLVASYSYVIRGDHDPGYLGLVQDQLRAVPYLYRVVLGGYALRDLAGPATGAPAKLGPGLLLALGEAACVAIALGAAWLLAGVGAGPAPATEAASGPGSAEPRIEADVLHRRPRGAPADGEALPRKGGPAPPR